ncbi:MAG: response regulator [Gammaproteobacteria bacterium]|nr:response regulator [Gammaproteobacteria bacterium]
MATILVVDDSTSMRQMVHAILKDSGYDVIEALDGQDALNKAMGRKFDLVITDLNMPRLDGIALVRELRSLPDYNFTPILMLTTESTTEIKKQGKATGVTGWLVKPFNPQQLLNAVKKALGSLS